MIFLTVDLYIMQISSDMNPCPVNSIICSLYKPRESDCAYLSALPELRAVLKLSTSCRLLRPHEPLQTQDAELLHVDRYSSFSPNDRLRVSVR